MKTYFITGGSSDIARAFMKMNDSSDVTFLCQYYSNEKVLKELAHGLKANVIPMKADLSKKNDVGNLTSQLAPYKDSLEVALFCAAGPFSFLHFKKIPNTTLEREFEIQINSTWSLCQFLFPIFSKKKNGQVLFLLSSVVHENISYLSAYTTIKYAQLGLMKSLATEYESKKIKVNAISPSMIETKYLDDVPEMLIDAAKEKNTDGKLLSVDEVAKKMSEIVNDMGLNGQNILFNKYKEK